jgi:parallel beta-helix repeat protein
MSLPPHSPGPRPDRGPKRRRTATTLITVLGLITSAVAVSVAFATSSSAAGELVRDTFARTATNGWGPAQVGGAYTFSDRTAFSVSGGRGVIKLASAGQSRQANLAVSSTDQVTTASVGVTALPTTGNGTYIALLARNGGGKAYRAMLTVKPGGTATLAVTRIDGSASRLTAIGPAVTLPNKVAARSLFKIELTTSGTSDVEISARAWPATGRAPTAQIKQTDSSAGRISTGGTFAIWAYTSSSSGASTVLVDDVTVRPPGGTATAPTTTTPTTVPAAATVAGAAGQPTQYGGAPALGSKSYAAPAGATFVSPTGNDSAAGTLAAPYRTIAKAVSTASSGQTIVLRRGTYHESVTIPSGKTLTIQPYRNEIVWLDGSSVVTGWVADGNRWRVDNWTAEFDASPTYKRGEPDNPEEHWGFVNPNYPMAAHPDQVWINNAPQAQVGSLGELGAGKFFVDYATDRLYLGSNPAGKTVLASDLSTAIKVRADGSVLRGFGVSRFAPSVPDLGAVSVGKPNAKVENMVFVDNATTGLSLVGTDLTVTNITSARNGMLGVHANYADRLTATGVTSLSNNLERFNSSPVSGGFKITRTRGITVKGGQFRDNLGPGLWLDESTYDSKIVNNKMINNSSHGVSVELSSTAVLVNNLLIDNDGYGMKINDISSVRVWNNTLINNNRPINIVQDTRRASNRSTAGHDPRQPFPDPTMTWINGPVEVRNNIIAGTTGNCLLCVEDYSKEFSAEQMGVSALGNVYQRANISTPTWVAVWSTGPGNPKVFTTLAAFKSATGQEAASLALDGNAATSSTGAPTAAVTRAVASVARPLPADLAALTGLGSGSKRLGTSLRK